MPLPRQEFIFVRHGQTDWNVAGRLQGHTDIPLNATGLEQAKRICATLLAEQVDVIISSPLVRAMKTAAFIAETHDRPIHIDSRLKERTFGVWEGCLSEELHIQHNIPMEERFDDHTPAGAESWAECRNRLTAVVGEWLARYPGKRVVFVGHGVAFRALMEVMTGESIHVENALPYVCTPVAEGWDITLTVPPRLSSVG